MIIREPLVTLDELSEHLSEAFDTPEKEKQARSFIRVASSKVRSAGRNWNRVDCPEIAHSICLESAARGWNNPGLLEGERADTLNYTFAKIAEAGCALSEDEKRDLRNAAGRTGGYWAVAIERDNTMSDEASEVSTEGDF